MQNLLILMRSVQSAGIEELIIFSSKLVRLMNRKLNFILVNLVDIGGVNTEIGDGTWFWKVSGAPSGRP